MEEGLNRRDTGGAPVPRGARLLGGFILVLVSILPTVSWGADWFVGSGRTGGDGSRGKPFNDPWRALAVASSGDVIHVASGVYYGRYDRSAWVIDRPRITVLGGYNADFSRRDPWKLPTVLAFYREYEGTNENNLLFGRDDHSGVVIDGIVIDGGGRNLYNEKPPRQLKAAMGTCGALVSFDSPDVVIRNCVMINSGTGAVELHGEGTRFENNIVMNHQGEAMLILRGAPGEGRRAMLITGNTFAFAHDATDPPMGKGGERGIAIAAGAAAVIENNVFAACGNTAVNLKGDAKGISIDRNVFWLNMRADVASRDGGRESVISDKNLDEMEDLGLKSCKENRVADVGLTGLNKEWMEGVSRNLMLAYATPPKEGLAALRGKYGLGEVAKSTGDNDLGAAAPYVEPVDACALRVEGDAGAKAIEMKVEIAGGSAAATVEKKYARMDWDQINAGAATLEGKPLEVLVAIGNEQNGFLKDGITEEKYIGFNVYGKGGENSRDQIHVYAVRNGAAHRQWQEANKSTNAREAEDWYWMRGIGRLTGKSQKATLEVEAIVPGEAPAKAVPARPKGRDWFVKAGASGGDGTKARPFRDPFQALEKAGEGDTIRVSGGDYFGKLKSANWKIANKNMALMGGYDGDFKARDPWKNPTRLVMSPAAEKKDKSEHSERFLESSEICDGLVLDGIVFDGSSVNAYLDSGGMDLRATQFGELVQLQGAGIAIRNCAFANASGMAVELSSASGVFENNVVVNSSGVSLSISADGPGPWVIRRNTFLFASDPTQRASGGQSGAGTHLVLRGRAAARIEGNIFGFADGCAIRATVPKDTLVVVGNAFAANLYCHLTDSNRVWLFDAVWERRLADAGFLAARNNVRTLPAGLGIDKEYGDKVFKRLFGLKGRYSRQEWTELAATAGASVRPPADATTEAAAEKPKTQKPKEQSLEDLMAQLDKLKKDSAKLDDAAAEKGPVYCPAYPWKKAMELAGDGAVGARRVGVE